MIEGRQLILALLGEAHFWFDLDEERPEDNIVLRGQRRATANSYIDGVALALGLPREQGDMSALLADALDGCEASDLDEQTFVQQVNDHLLAVVAERLTS